MTTAQKWLVGATTLLALSAAALIALLAVEMVAGVLHGISTFVHSFDGAVSF